MDSKEYWRKREAENLEVYLKEEEEYTRRLNEIYDRTLDNVQREINAFYGKYAAAEGISIAEAKKRVSELDIAEYERKAQKYVAERDFSKQANEEMRLYNLTMKVNRLEMLKANIGLECIAGHDELEKYMGDILKGRTMEELERQAGILGKSIRNNAELANAIVNASFHNAKFSDRIWMNQSLLKAELEKSLQTGLIQGRNARALARDLQKQFGVSKYNAERLMRTELARVQTEAQKQSFENNGFEEYEFITNSGCCDACQALDGKHFKVKSMMPGDNAPPLHPNCRCSIAAYVDSEEYEAWLDYLANGGTTEQWNAWQKQEFEKSHKGVNRNSVMNKSVIESSGYRRKFDAFGESEQVSKRMYDESVRAITHRSGTVFEDLVFINSKTNEVLRSVDYEVPKTAKPTKRMLKMLSSSDDYSIIGIHNHPDSYTPSIDDVIVARDRKYKYGIVVGHNGIIYKYSISGEVNEVNADVYLANIGKLIYNKDKIDDFDKEMTSTLEHLRNAGVDLEVLQ